RPEAGAVVEGERRADDGETAGAGEATGRATPLAGARGVEGVVGVDLGLRRTVGEWITSDAPVSRDRPSRTLLLLLCSSRARLLGVSGTVALLSDASVSCRNASKRLGPPAEREGS